MLRIICGNSYKSFSNFLNKSYKGICRNFVTQAALKDASIKNETKFSIGKTYNGFSCTAIQEIKEFNMIALTFTHEKSKAEYLHLQRDDQNNVFSINFRTTPLNSTGLPHILEHTVLCGSKKYPVRDPFFKMLNRSLATFMNALTGPDYTFYPFSSQNEVDYRNLQKIYLDAVFQPNLNYLDFLQEGWRLEHSKLQDPTSELVFKGVVFNEMKGAFSENSAIFGQNFLNTILPSHTYGFISGGDPLYIPHLTVKELREFHSKYYHPSNCRIYSYGNFPVERNLEICDQLYLSNYDSIDNSYSMVPSESRWSQPVEKQITCRFNKMGAPIEKQNQIAVGYLMNDIRNLYESFNLHILSELMMVGPNSAFYKSLIEPNISGGYNGVTGFDSHMKDTMFIVGLQDLEVDKFDTVKDIIDNTIDKVIKEGFDKKHIDGVLHGYELGIKHQTTKFGMNTLFNLVPLWNHGGNILEALQIVKYLNNFKKNIEDPKYLTSKVEQYFKSNNHKLTMTMIPDENFENDLLKKEQNLLQTKISVLNDEEKKFIYDEGLKLAENQKAQQNIELLPCLSLNDISKKPISILLKKTKLNLIPTQICEANTNNVIYFKGILNMDDLQENLKLLIPIFNSTITKMNTKNYSYCEFDQLINLKTGGIGFSTHISSPIDDPKKIEQGVMVSSSCLNHNIDGMLDILYEIFDKPLFKDVERFKMLFDNYVSCLTPGVASSGHIYAMQSANSLIRSGSLLIEKLSGLKHIDFIKKLHQKGNIEDTMKNMVIIGDYILNARRMRMAINLSKDDKGVVSKFETFTKDKSFDHDITNTVLYDENGDAGVNGLHYLTNFSVNYCAKSIMSVPFMHDDFSKLQVLAKFLSSKYLHPLIREQNGAYGSGARISNGGVFNFYSYRDPNSSLTLDIFDDVRDWLQNCGKNILDDQTLFEAKLGVLQQLDAPIAEFNKGLDEFLVNLNSDLLERHRNLILKVTKEDIYEVCEKYLVDNLNNKLIVGKCVIGPGELPESGKSFIKNSEKWTVIKPEPEE